MRSPPAPLPTPTTAATWPSPSRPSPWARPQGYEVRDEAKLLAVAAKHGIATKGRKVNEIALDVANKAISEFGQQRGELSYLSTAPAKRQTIWREQGVVPRGIDREVVEILHRTHMGDDQDASHILQRRAAHGLWPTAGAARCGPPTSPTSCSAPPARAWARSTWAC